MRGSRHAWLLAAALAACSGGAPHWHKTGASEAMVQEDSDECRRQARVALLPERRAPARTPGEPSTLLTGEEERALSELRHFQRCMREKGYSAER
jgi:hypothetical protein